ncbi:hypothetical protein INT45_006570 [Circinella minor]|uniref:Uncharacterized protein n=1 Tax=Circinella minor TaxID=1195481 RepID=A0A8H7S0G4_9FUNG|nr:hypothetical protein INT45_006570 [Circinella minor]
MMIMIKVKLQSFIKVIKRPLDFERMGDIKAEDIATDKEKEQSGNLKKIWSINNNTDITAALIAYRERSIYLANLEKNKLSDNRVLSLKFQKTKLSRMARAFANEADDLHENNEGDDDDEEEDEQGILQRFAELIVHMVPIFDTWSDNGGP